MIIKFLEVNKIFRKISATLGSAERVIAVSESFFEQNFQIKRARISKLVEVMEDRVCISLPPFYKFENYV
jgi:hypothetical protein